MTITLAERFEILTRDGFTCQYCGRQAPETELEVDHVQPRSQRGTDERRNLVTTCRDCNRGKGDKAARPPQRNRGLPGRFFHSFDRLSGRIQRQGMFKEDLGDGYFVNDCLLKETACPSPTKGSGLQGRLTAPRPAETGQSADEC